MPQPPQCAIAVFVSVSHPLLASPSQLPKPAPHVNPQTPVAHVDVAFARAGHAIPQPPQFAALVLVFTSQPSNPFPLQLPKPALHAIPHTRAAHVAVPFAGTAQRVPHAPQCSGLLVMSTSHPSVATALQLPKPVLHANEHALEAHVADALGAGGQTRPHIPQCETVLVVVVSHPLDTSMSQLPVPAAHAIPQTPSAHAGLAPPPPAQTLPHIPQCVRLVFVLVSQPLVATPSQLPKPALQLSVQRPITHAPVALVPLGHTLPHVPQLLRSLCKSTQREVQRSGVGATQPEPQR
jgi:hypothetical protein